MAEPVGKRQFHTFLSHAHVDKDRADQLVEWLRDMAGVPVWYDQTHMRPGATIAQALPEAIEDSRSLTLLLSKESVAKGWVQHEYHAAINHQTQYRGFRIIPIRLDDVSPPGFLQNYSTITLGENGLDAPSAAGILRGLYQPATSIDPTGGRNVYVSRGWHPGDEDFAETVCQALKNAGLQLIGDAEDQPSWVETRIVDIMAGCGAFAAILPYRPTTPHKTSKYILREWELALTRDLPCLVIADPRIELPPEITGRPGLVTPDDSGTGRTEHLAQSAAAFAEDWTTPVRSPYVFYATDFETDGKPLRHAVKELVEAITTLPCVLGEYVKGDVVQREILRAVAQAKLVLADISGNGPNVYIEVGAARSADVPIFLLRQGPPGRPAFMLRDQQVWDYASDSDLLGRVAQIVYPYRRTLLSPQRF
jgi:hypothetical protein